MYRASVKGLMLDVKNDALIKDLQNKVLKIESMAGEMSHKASHDMLTGLINRREFDTRLKQAIADVKYNKRNHCKEDNSRDCKLRGLAHNQQADTRKKRHNNNIYSSLHD